MLGFKLIHVNKGATDDVMVWCGYTFHIICCLCEVFSVTEDVRNKGSVFGTSRKRTSAKVWSKVSKVSFKEFENAVCKMTAICFSLNALTTLFRVASTYLPPIWVLLWYISQLLILCWFPDISWRTLIFCIRTPSTLIRSMYYLAAWFISAYFVHRIE